MPKVRVILSMHPDQPVEVEEDELPGLKAQGLLVGYEGETDGADGKDGSDKGGPAGTSADGKAAGAGKRAPGETK